MCFISEFVIILCQLFHEFRSLSGMFYRYFLAHYACICMGFCIQMYVTCVLMKCFACPDSSKVINLTVDGQEVSNVHLINEQQEVNVSCFFVNGNPPVTFRLLDKTSKELATDKGSLHLSLSVKCEDDWPIVRCEGEGSELNRSVAFLVRCK